MIKAFQVIIYRILNVKIDNQVPSNNKNIVFYVIGSIFWCLIIWKSVVLDDFMYTEIDFKITNINQLYLCTNGQTANNILTQVRYQINLKQNKINHKTIICNNIIHYFSGQCVNLNDRFSSEQQNGNVWMKGYIQKYQSCPNIDLVYPSIKQNFYRDITSDVIQIVVYHIILVIMSCINTDFDQVVKFGNKIIEQIACGQLQCDILLDKILKILSLNYLNNPSNKMITENFSLLAGSILLNSSGLGSYHEISNKNQNDKLRFIQITLNTRMKGCEPQSQSYKSIDQLNKLINVVTDFKSNIPSPLKINQKIIIQVCKFSQDVELNIQNHDNCYIFQLEYGSQILFNDCECQLQQFEVLHTQLIENIILKPMQQKSHVLIILA